MRKKYQKREENQAYYPIETKLGNLRVSINDHHHHRGSLLCNQSMKPPSSLLSYPTHLSLSQKLPSRNVDAYSNVSMIPNYNHKKNTPESRRAFRQWLLASLMKQIGS